MSLKLPAIRFFGNTDGISGYSHATRNISTALSNSRLQVSFGYKRNFFKGLKKFEGNPKIDLYLQTPPFSKHKSKNYKIGYFYWEADTLPKLWAKDIRTSVDELWVPCNLTKRACLKAGFKGPIEVLYTPCDMDMTYSKVSIPSPISDSFVLDDNTFKFYSVFQWNERKGYRTLLKAYYNEFDANENVVLVLKVNPVNYSGHGLSKIKNDILKIKKTINKKNLPRIYLITKSLKEEELFGLHKACDAFVLPHHGEGWGMPIHDAMLCDSYVITTKFGGITELLDDSSSFIINHDIRPAKVLDWSPWYGAYQSWARPNCSHLMMLMRKVYANEGEFKTKLEEARCIASSMDLVSFSDKVERILSKPRFKKFI
jgi:glycosyltransferase involved in cell wall biosynthesis